LVALSLPFFWDWSDELSLPFILFFSYLYASDLVVARFDFGLFVCVGSGWLGVVGFDFQRCSVGCESRFKEIWLVMMILHLIQWMLGSDP
jgi:hypothetical protein